MRNGAVRRSIAGWTGAALLGAMLPSGATAGSQSDTDPEMRAAWTAAGEVIEAVESSRREMRRAAFGDETTTRNWSPSPSTDARFEADFRPASDDTATLIFDASPGRPVRLAIVPGGADIAPVTKTLDATAEELTPLIAEIRRLALLRPRASLGRIVRLGDELGRKLLAPAADQLRGTSRVVLLANGPLVELPFGAIRAPRSIDPQGRFLVETRELCWLTPGEVRLQTATESERRQQPPVAAAIADAVYRPPTRPLGASMSDGGISWRRHAARRNQSQAPEALGLMNVTAFGQAASPAALWDLSAGHRIEALHLAIEAIVDAEEPAASALLLSPSRYDQQALRVSVRDLASDLELGRDPVVVLSGLDTGGAGLGPSPFVDAFDAAGATLVVSSLWPVVDETATRLFEVFYRRLALGTAPSTALREAQLTLLAEPLRFDQGEGLEPAEFDASHPFYWAGYGVHQRSAVACSRSAALN